jgi:hypothetical protein
MALAVATVALVEVILPMGLLQRGLLRMVLAVVMVVRWALPRMAGMANLRKNQMVPGRAVPETRRADSKAVLKDSWVPGPWAERAPLLQEVMTMLMMLRCM